MHTCGQGEARVQGSSPPGMSGIGLELVVGRGPVAGHFIGRVLREGRRHAQTNSVLTCGFTVCGTSVEKPQPGCDGMRQRWIRAGSVMFALQRSRRSSFALEAAEDEVGCLVGHAVVEVRHVPVDA